VRSVGIVSPGAMGSALGARLVEGGAAVTAAVGGRSPRTQALAAGNGIGLVATLDELVDEVDVVLSVVPPGAALAVAAELAAAAGRTGAAPLVADLNAIAPASARALEELLAGAGLELVDGSVSGPPPLAHGSTRVYLSGERAAELAALPLTGVEVRVVGAQVGLASAVKMCTASVYKGRVALLAQALRTAHHHGVVEHVLDDLVDTGLADPQRTGETLARASTKAWRYVDEMREIAATQAAAGLSPDLFTAFAAVWEGLAAHALAESPEDVREGAALKDVLERLAGEIEQG
jgi:3-hydroxyisobutyrate dehydrogenase-like beta-hydroxyacid dehydrogenase